MNWFNLAVWIWDQKAPQPFCVGPIGQDLIYVFGKSAMMHLLIKNKHTTNSTWPDKRIFDNRITGYHWKIVVESWLHNTKTVIPTRYLKRSTSRIGNDSDHPNRKMAAGLNEESTMTHSSDESDWDNSSTTPTGRRGGDVGSCELLDDGSNASSRLIDALLVWSESESDSTEEEWKINLRELLGGTGTSSSSSSSSLSLSMRFLWRGPVLPVLTCWPPPNISGDDTLSASSSKQNKLKK